jgi:uracil-DNA glycosylase
VLKTTTGITRLRGSLHRTGRFAVLPIFHPAAALYDITKRDTLFSDFALLGAVLAQPEEEPAEPVQGELFEA